jgi:hypothetical protein
MAKLNSSYLRFFRLFEKWKNFTNWISIALLTTYPKWGRMSKSVEHKRRFEGKDKRTQVAPSFLAL